MASMKIAAKPGAKEDQMGREAKLGGTVRIETSSGDMVFIVDEFKPCPDSIKTPLAEFKELLAEYPMDDQQRDSVFANAQTLPEPQVVAMIQRMRTTLEQLEAGLSELKKQMPFEEGVEFSSHTSAVAAYAASIPG